jgi:IclR family acetate operon transcriptional repressor
MPRIINSLLFAARSHQVGEMPDAGMTALFGAADSPNACLLCHRTRTWQGSPGRWARGEGEEDEQDEGGRARDTFGTESGSGSDRGSRKSNDPVPLGQLRLLLGLNRSTIFRLVSTLRRRGFLANPNGRNDYIIGSSIWRLFPKYDWTTLVGSCRHHLKLLAAQTGETAHLAVREGRQALFIAHQTSGNQIIAVSGRTGEFMPLHCTAHGKALLADCGLPELKAILGAEEFETHTKKTIDLIEELAKDCAQIKAQGFALDEAEFLGEVRCVAAPIRDKDGVVVAAIGISAPVARLSPARLPGATRQVTAAAPLISEVLSAEPGEKHTYSILSTNSAGVPSEPSAAVFVPSPESGKE